MQDETSKRKQAARPLTVALVGFGTVGSSVAKLLCRDSAGPLRLTHIFNRDVARKKVSWVPAGVRWTEDIEEVLASDVDVITELIGGLHPAGEWVRRALASGKSVVTANKHLMAECGLELISLAQKNGQRIEFGASVAGGIPALVGLQEGLAGDRLLRVAGILNGTCNYILSQMEARGISFAAALREAQELGFAESDPSEDLEGFDARAKLVILARAGLGVGLRTGEILCRSISSIEAADFVYARELNSTIRQISIVQKDSVNGSCVLAAVQPAVISLSSPMAHVRGNQNLVMAVGESGGETSFIGCGAGGDPTAVAVVSDLLAIARESGVCAVRAPAEIVIPEKVSGEMTLPHFVRFTVQDRPGIIAALAAILAGHSINIDAVLQKPGHAHSRLPFVMTLHACSSAVLDRALEEMSQLDFHVQPPVCLPMLSS